MSSKVAICNFALLSIGGNKIASLTEDSREARLCNAFFDMVVKWVISEGPWSVCIESVELAKTSTTPTLDYLYEYQLPSDCIRILEIEEANDDTDAWIKKGTKIWTDIDSVKIKYLKLETDPEQYSPELEQAIVTRLAAELARPLSGLQQLRDSLLQEYRILVHEGLAKDGQQGSNQFLSIPDLDEVR